jgi:hypothetical protein
MQSRGLVLFSYGQKDTDALGIREALVIGEQEAPSPTMNIQIRRHFKQNNPHCQRYSICQRLSYYTVILPSAKIQD